MIVIFGITTLDFAEMQKMVQNKKKKKNSDQKFLLWVFWAKSFKKLLYLKSSFQYILYISKISRKSKCLNSGPKEPYLAIFRLEF